VINEGVLVRILSSGSIIVYNLGFRCAYSLNLIKWISYKARDPIEFKGGKGSSSFNLFLDFLFSLFY
jgi:methionine salvage enolase-phosphatase E1